MGFKEKLQDMHDALRDAATEARGLENQNLADILDLGRARIAQALEHPDIDGVDKVEQPHEPAPVTGEQPAAPLNPFDLSGVPPATQAPGQ